MRADGISDEWNLRCAGAVPSDVRLAWMIGVLAILVAACSTPSGAPRGADGTATASTVSGASGPTTTPSTAPEEYPDLVLRRHWQAMQAARPVEGSAMPPKHLDEESFPTTLVDRNEIVPGGPPPDGIPSIDDPVFVRVDRVTDLESDEAVIVLQRDEDTRIYPVRIMIWHEIVNDVVDGAPVTVTYCPLCNSAIAYLRTVDGEVLDFGTSGHLYRSAMVMYDRQTESLWTHFDGRAVVGTSIGAQLDRLPVATVSWQQASDAHPDALVLRGDPVDPKPYGTNPYVGYDQGDEPLRGWFTIDIPEPVPPMTRIVGVRTAGGELAVPTELVAERRVVTSSIGTDEFVIFHEAGTASPLHRSGVADGDDIGSTGVFDTTIDGRRLTFRESAGVIVDDDTSSVWNVRGQAIVGPLVGTELDELEHLDTFWFAWVAHHPETMVVVDDTP